MNAPPAVLPAAAAALTPSAAPLHALALLRYGAPSLAFAFVVLPLYVYLPEHYATRYAVPLGYLGGVLLLTRFADALLTPGWGGWPIICCDAAGPNRRCSRPAC